MKHSNLIVVLMLGILCFSISNNVFAQDTTKNSRFKVLEGSKSKQEKIPFFSSKWLSKHPIDISFGKALVGMPFSKRIFEKPFYPMISLGTEFYYKQKKHSDFFQTAKINYYYAKYSTSAIVLNTEIGYRYIFNSGLFIDGVFGIGYSNLFRPNAIYKTDRSGEYKQVRDYGSPSVMADYTLTVGYNFAKKNDIPISLYLKYGSYADILYAPEIPVLPQSIIHIGTRFYIKNKNKSKI